ncbi:MAG: BCD family MFS transporter [Gammaproteobacteria bacterium]|nr:BCD family MFS transporter [Gammaproteobacteria bacterium]
MSGAASLGWLGIVRLGLIQAALGSIVVLTTSTLNRVMVVEFALPAMLPGALVALHHAIQMSRPRFGYGSDVGGRRTPWIIGGMLVLATGGVTASLGTALMGVDPVWGSGVALLGFVLIGLGVGACGTSLLVFLAKRVDAGRRAAAATIVWVMMIVGFAVTAGVAGHFLDPFSPQRLVLVTASVAAIAVVVTVLAMRNLEVDRQPGPDDAGSQRARRIPFRTALAGVWQEQEARRFTVFVFVSMLAYSAQDLILEPFAGLVFGMTPGESTQLSGVQHAGVLLGMLIVAITGTLLKRHRSTLLRHWTIGGCAASAVALFVIAAGGFVGPGWPLNASVFALGVANGAFAVAAIGSMMALAGHGRENREGLRMGLWGAAQAIAFGLGGFLGTVAVDTAKLFFAAPEVAYAIVFCAEGGLFIAAAVLAVSVHPPRQPAAQHEIGLFGDADFAEVAEGR